MHLKNETFIYKMKVKRANRSFIKKHRSCIIWLTGLSGAGKSTVADLLEQKLNKQNKHTFLLDGDNLRHTLNQDLGFSDDDRNENIRRIGHVGKLMVDAGLIVIASFISPFEKQRELTRKLFDKNEYIEVFLNSEYKNPKTKNYSYFDAYTIFPKRNSSIISDLNLLFLPFLNLSILF